MGGARVPVAEAARRVGRGPRGAPRLHRGLGRQGAAAGLLDLGLLLPAGVPDGDDAGAAGRECEASVSKPTHTALHLAQNYARAHALPIDTLSWDFRYLNRQPAEGIAAKPADGCYIRGLFLEGARYDEGAGLLADSLPKQLYTPLPVMHLVPVQHRPQPTTRVYRCPVYKILSRWGVLATTGHSSNFVLFIEIPSDRPDITNNVGEADIGVWVRAGVAAFTSLKF